jgi:hypothetical protein
LALPSRANPDTVYIIYIKPLKMDMTEGSETSANINQTPGNHPKVDILDTEHGESLKSRIASICLGGIVILRERKHVAANL